MGTNLISNFRNKKSLLFVYIYIYVICSLTPIKCSPNSNFQSKIPKSQANQFLTSNSRSKRNIHEECILRNCHTSEIFEYAIVDRSQLSAQHNCYKYIKVEQSFKQEMQTEFNYFRDYYWEEVQNESSIFNFFSFHRRNATEIVYNFLNEHICGLKLADEIQEKLNSGHSHGMIHPDDEENLVFNRSVGQDIFLGVFRSGASDSSEFKLPEKKHDRGDALTSFDLFLRFLLLAIIIISSFCLFIIVCGTIAKKLSFSNYTTNNEEDLVIVPDGWHYKIYQPGNQLDSPYSIRSGLRTVITNSKQRGMTTVANVSKNAAIVGSIIGVGERPDAKQGTFPEHLHRSRLCKSGVNVCRSNSLGPGLGGTTSTVLADGSTCLQPQRSNSLRNSYVSEYTPNLNCNVRRDAVQSFGLYPGSILRKSDSRLYNLAERNIFIHPNGGIKRDYGRGNASLENKALLNNGRPDKEGFRILHTNYGSKIQHK